MKYILHVPPPRTPKPPPTLGGGFTRRKEPEPVLSWWDKNPDDALAWGLRNQIRASKALAEARAKSFPCVGGCGKHWFPFPDTTCYWCRKGREPNELPPVSVTHTTAARDDAKRAARLRATRKR